MSDLDDQLDKDQQESNQNESEVQNPILYTGKKKNNKRHGLGKLVYPDGSIYEGFFKEDLRSGKGKLTLKDGHVYEGNWVHGTIEGQGVYKSGKGFWYKGMFKNNSAEGEGALLFGINKEEIADEEEEENFIEENEKEIDLEESITVTETEQDEITENEDEKFQFNYEKLENFAKENCSGSAYVVANFDNGYIQGSGKLHTQLGDYEGEFNKNLLEGDGSCIFVNHNEYKGSFSKGKIEGFGIMNYPDETVYEGEWVDGKREGKGKMFDQKEGELIPKTKGFWKEGMMHGRVEILNSSGGVEETKYYFENKVCIEKTLELEVGVYEGQVAEGEPFGYGTLTAKDDEYLYEGEWLFGVKNGHGKLKHLKEKFVYQGDFKEGEITGKGRMKVEGKGIYEGQFLKGKMSCLKGKFTSEDKETNYEGNWKNGKFEGRGVLTKGKDVYDGEFQDNCFSGFGVMNFSNGNIYMGKWELNEMSGFGEMKFKDGSNYQGNWKADKMNGKGVYEKPEGDTYNCTFSDGEMIGEGKITYTNGDLYEGELLNFQKKGKGEMKYSDGRRYEGMWLDDLFHGKGTLYNKEGVASEIELWNKGEEAEKGILRTSLGRWKGGKEDNKPYGEGYMLYNKQSEFRRFDGNWDKNGPEGPGKLVYKDGRMYEGEFKDGKRSGDGTLEKNSEVIFKGFWEDDKKHGHGKFVYYSPVDDAFGLKHFIKQRGAAKEDSEKSSDIKSTKMDFQNSNEVKHTYTGNFEKGEMNGAGVLQIFHEKFKGNWEKGKKHGKFVKTSIGNTNKATIFFYKDRQCTDKSVNELTFEYKGMVAPENGKIHGKGIKKFKAQEGQISHEFNGEFFEGNMHGPGKMIYYKKKLRVATDGKKGKSFSNRNKESQGLKKDFNSRSNKVFFDGRKSKMNNSLIFSKGSDLNSLFKSSIDVVINHKINPPSHRKNNVKSRFDKMKENSKAVLKNGKRDSFLEGLPKSKQFMKREELNTQFDFTEEISIIVTGTWKEGKLTGKGKIEKPVASEQFGNIIYDGEFNDDKKEGNGKFIFKNKNVYIGGFKSDTLQGFGTMKYANGDIYQGEWVKGKRHGKGELRTKQKSSDQKGTLIFKGTWEKDYFHNGEIKNKTNGEKYIGGVKNWKRSGKGVLTFRNGQKYEGSFLEGKYDGSGKLEYSNGDVYKGQWLNGKRNGEGKMTYADGSFYSGNWIEGKKSGKGQMTYPDSSFYEGFWLEDKKHKKGVYKINNRFVYEGNFYNDKMRGHGMATFPGGIKFEGNWENDLPVGFTTINLNQKNVVSTGYFKEKYKLGQVIFNKNWNVLYGSIKFENGDTYKGSLKSQKFEGNGVYTWKETGSRYTGEFKNGACNGHGRLELQKRRWVKMIEGEFENNKITEENVENMTFDKMKTPIKLKDGVQDVPKMQDEKYTLDYQDDKTTIEDIRAIVSIESAYKMGYISKVDNFKEYRKFCDALEVENVLNKRYDLILEALESFSLKELLTDILKTGSVSQRYIIIEIILKINLEFLIVFDSVRIAMINPFDRIMYRAANASVYKATNSKFIEEIQEVLMNLDEEVKCNDSGPLIYDEMMLIIIQTGLFDLTSMLSVFKNIANVYEDLMIEEQKTFSGERSVFKKRFKNYARRRIVLANTILQAIVQLRDFQILNKREDVFKKYFRNLVYSEFKADFDLYFNDILAILISLFEDYVTNEFYGKEFTLYLDNNTNMSEICLNISYVFFLVSGMIEENYDQNLPDNLSSIHKEHVLKSEFFDAKRKCKNSSFTFGFYLKENLENYDFGRIFKQVENCVVDGKIKENCLNVQDLSEMLIPAIIVCFSSNKKLDEKHHLYFEMTLDEEFSIFQLNSEHTMEKFIRWMRKNDIKGKEDVSDWIDQRGLIYIDFTEYIRRTRKDEKDSKNVKIMNAIIKRIDSINNVKKGLKLSPSQIDITKIDNIKEIACVEFSSENFNEHLPIEKNLKFVDDMDDKEYNFLITLLEIRFEYITLPKFLLRNSSSTIFNLEKYNTLHLYTKEIVRDPLTNLLMKKEILHALIIGYTIRFRSFNINEIAYDLDLYMQFFRPKNKNCNFSQDFVYLLSLVCANIWFSEHDALGFEQDRDLKDEELEAFKFINRVIKKSTDKFQKEDTELILLEEIDEDDKERKKLKKKKEENFDVNGVDLDDVKMEDSNRNEDDFTKELENINSDSEEIDLQADSNMNAMKQMKKQKSSFRLRLKQAKGSNSRPEYPLQWVKLNTIFVTYSDLMNNARQLIIFDVDKALKKMAKGETLIELKQVDDEPESSHRGLKLSSFRLGNNRSMSIMGMEYSHNFMNNDDEEENLMKVKKKSKQKKRKRNLEFTRAKGQRNGTPYHQPKINLKKLENPSNSRFAQRVMSEIEIRILTRHLTKATSIFYDNEEENIKKILDGDSTSLKMITIVKDLMEKNKKLQKIIVNELNRGSDERKGIKGMVKSSILMYLSQRSKKSIDENRIESAYLDSFAYYWLLRKDLNYFVKNISENNNMAGKLLFFKLESSTNLMKLYLKDLQTNLEKGKSINKTELALQKWKLEQLQELCVGPCVKNQIFMTQRDYLSIYDFKFLNRNIPLDGEHPKFKRDLSLVNFYQSVIEGGNSSIVSKLRLQIKPEEILSYIKTLLLILEANWSHSSIEKLKEELRKGGKGRFKGIGQEEMIQKKRDIRKKIKKFKTMHIRSSKIVPYSKKKRRSLQRNALKESKNNLEKSKSTVEHNSYDSLKYYINSQFLTDLISNLTYDNFKEKCIETRYGQSIIYDLIVSAYLLMIGLSDDDPFKPLEIVEKDHASNLLRVFISNMRVVELTNMSHQSEVIVFPLVQECTEITESVRKKVMEDFDPHSPTGLFYSILLEINNTKRVLEMKVDYRKRFGLIYLMIRNNTIYWVKVILMTICFVMNALIITDGKEFDRKDEWNATTKTVLLYGDITIIGVSFIYISLISSFKYPLMKINSLNRNNKIRVRELANDYLQQSANFWFHFIFAIISISYSTTAYTYHLLLVVTLFESTMFIMRALMKNFTMLLSTFIYMVILIYSFSYVIALRFNDNFDSQVVGTIRTCDTFARCFIYTLDYGLIFGGGIAEALEASDYKSRDFPLKTFIDISFFILVNVILLNIIFGLIIDAFAELRDESNDKNNFLKGSCLVCMNLRRELENANNNFMEHVKDHHAVMRYIEYFLYIMSKEESSYNGIEYYVSQCIEEKNVNFLPDKNTRFLISGDARNMKEKKKDKIDNLMEEMKLQRKNFDSRLKMMERRLESLGDGVDKILKFMAKAEKD